MPDKPIEEWTDEEMSADPIGALCRAVKDSGCTMTLYGQPVGEAGLRHASLVGGLARLAGEPLTPDEARIAARVGDGLEDDESDRSNHR